MATQVRIRRGTAAEHATFTGAQSEITHDTTNNTLRVHDGVTPGGFAAPSPAEFQTLMDAKQGTAAKGQPNGYASLDATGKVPAGQLPAVLGGSAEVVTPSNVAPSDTAVDQPSRPAFQASAFYSLYSQTHVATQLQISTLASFTSPLYDSGDGPATTTPTIAADILSKSTQYHWRVRYKNSRGVYSSWSVATSFTTASVFNSYIPTPMATPAIGASFEGGYYAGLIWNEVVQSASKVTIGSASGQRTFTVADMVTTPIVYGGQVLEIRSRDNPANKIVGVVASAIGTALVINVTAVSGSGTFTDWSIMARYRVIVAPKAVGEFSSALATDSVVPQALLIHPSEGWKTTLLWQAQGTAVNYPAPHAARALSIGGKTDWYIPSRDELELCYRNLKPDSSSNDTSTRAQIGGTIAYAAYPDGSPFTSGGNSNSYPASSAYTTTVPAMTSIAAFQSGGSEGWAFGYYSTCSGYGSTQVYVQAFSSGQPGLQLPYSPAYSFPWRAVRRSII